MSRLARLGTAYHEWVRHHPQASDDFADAFEDLLTDGGVTFDRVSARVKTWPSLKAKAQKRRADGRLAYPDPWNDIHDLIGVRINVYHSTEIPVALAVLRESFEVVRSVDKTAQTRVSGGFGYGSHHLVLRVPPHHEDLRAYAGMRLEAQVRTVLQHAWAEFEHDIRYKSGQLDPQVDRAFTLAAGLIELADQQFDQIAALRKPTASQPDRGDVDISAETLPGILAMLLGTRFPPSRSENYRWLEELLAANGVTTVAELSALLDPAAIASLDERLHYRFTPGQVRLIDDLLLLRFGQQHIDRTGTTGYRAKNRPRRLAERLAKLRP
ncbi:GTP pyrophosphokinase [Corynebacterium uterequi]|uniref:RelA/SpoT domain-containing protein n=1 Tax=Corynebacterium uterequi TaxID=1072256 RepID=A0A0G3HDP1_9CORY|nr:GTP pyrophosphokinase [Corynebacterium uterequi]AKK11429.1 hypothetical protein CUTER_07200 [Corynebacterium uterequi]